jgi:hypothetical protein
MLRKMIEERQHDAEEKSKQEPKIIDFKVEVKE